MARSRQTSLAELLDTWAAIADDFEAVVGELQIWPVTDRRTVPPLCFDLGDVDLVTVGGAAEHRVRTNAFEVTRICLGRRSIAQVLGMDGSSPVPAAPDGLFVFGPRPFALCE